MVEWLAGNRIIGTTAERPNFGLPSGSVGGWVELGRHVIGTASSEVFVASLPDKRYYMVLYEDKGEASAQARLLRYNSDANNIYSNRVSTNGASDTEQNTQPQHNGWNGNNTTPQFNVWHIANLAGKEKLLISEGVMQSNPPARVEYAGKSTLSAVINRIGVIQNASTHSTGTTMTVLGWDPTDTHTTNFWEELASVEYSGGTALTSGTIYARKYLWVQAYLKIASGTVDSNLWGFNAENTGTNYSARYSRDGVFPDGTNTGISHMNINFGAGTRNNQLINMFIINNSANEKLVTGSGISQAASGSGTAPNRLEFVSKWSNTSDQITSIQCTQGNSLNFESGTIMKVWGSD